MITQGKTFEISAGVRYISDDLGIWYIRYGKKEAAEIPCAANGGNSMVDRNVTRNDSERRRRELLEQTRQLYSDRFNPPAIHPRYSGSYNRIYGEEGEGNGNGGTFGARGFLCLLLFAAFVTMDMKKQEVFHVDSERIVKEITTDMDVAEVWKNL